MTHGDDAPSGLEPFDATVSGAGATAPQQSTIGRRVFEARGGTAAATSWSLSGTSPAGLHEGYGRAQSRYSVDFDVAEATPYHLTGAARYLGPAFGPAVPARVALSGPAGVVAEVTHLESLCDPVTCADEPPAAIDASGVLAPGSYSLEAELDATAAGYASPGGVFGDGFEGLCEVRLRLGAEVPAVADPSVGALALALGLTGGLRLVRSRRPRRPRVLG